MTNNSEYQTTVTRTRNTFYALMFKVKYSERYYELYYNDIQKIDNGFSIFTGLTSAAAIAGWGIWNEFRIVWAILVAVAQVGQIVRPHLPFSYHLSSLKYLIPELRTLTVEMESDWARFDVDQPDPQTYLEKIRFFNERYTAIESKYLGSDILPVKQGYFNNARDEARNHYSLLFGIQKDDSYEEGGE